MNSIDFNMMDKADQNVWMVLNKKISALETKYDAILARMDFHLAELEDGKTYGLKCGRMTTEAMERVKEMIEMQNFKFKLIIFEEGVDVIQLSNETLQTQNKPESKEI